MSKLGMAGAVVGVGGTGAAGIYGAHKMGWFGGSSTEKPKDEEKSKKEEQNKYLIGKTKDEFIKASTNNNGGCLDNIFKEWTVPATLAEPSSAVSLDATPKETEGCLVFNWEKKREGEESPKENNLRFVWSLAKGNAGFAVYVSGTAADAEKDNIKVTFDGAAYVFKKNNDKWEVGNRIDLKKDNQALEQSTDIAGKFPKLAAAMKGKLEGLKEVEGEYWGFLESNGGDRKSVV